MVSCIRGKYIYMYWYSTVLSFVLVYIPGTSIFFIWGHVHSCPVHCVVVKYAYIYICATGTIHRRHAVRSASPPGTGAAAENTAVHVRR